MIQNISGLGNGINLSHWIARDDRDDEDETEIWTMPWVKDPARQAALLRELADKIEIAGATLDLDLSAE